MTELIAAYHSCPMALFLCHLAAACCWLLIVNLNQPCRVQATTRRLIRRH